MKQRLFDSVLRDIAMGMNEYYKSGEVAEVNTTCFTMYLIGGALFALAAVFWFFKL